MPGLQVEAAVAGAGLMGTWHAAELVRAGGSLVAVVDPDRASAAALAARAGGARCFSRLEELLASSPPEALHVCTPLESHAELVEQALRAGVHTLVEKPLAPDAGATRRLLQLAEERGVLLCPVHQYVFQAGVRRAEWTLPRVAPLVRAESTACSAGGMAAPGTPLDRIAADILPHPLAVLERLLPAGLEPLHWAAERPREGELRALAVADGTDVSICLSMNGRPPRNELRLIGEGGTVHLDFFHGYGFVERRGGPSRVRKALQPFALSGARTITAGGNLARRAIRREPAYPGLRDLIEGFYEAIRGAGTAPISPHETRAVAGARDAVLAAASLRVPGARGRTAQSAAGS